MYAPQLRPVIQVSEDRGAPGAGEHAARAIGSQPLPGDDAQPILVLGQSVFRRQRQRFGLLPGDRLRHIWIVGKTGSGKSTLLANLVAQDLARGNGLALLDPHGDLVEAVLPLVPSARTNEVLLFSPEDRDYPVSFNVFRQGRRQHLDQALLTSGLVTVFRKYWSDSWGPRLEHVLRNAILAVAPDPRATLLFLYRFLTDDGLREKVVGKVADPVVRTFWTREFPGYTRSLQSEALSPALNKLGAFVAQPVVRNIVAQERSRVDLVHIMNSQGVLLAKLGTGAIGEDASHLLGGLLLSALQLAAMERGSASRTESARRGARTGQLEPSSQPPFIIYVDEFHHFVTDSLATLLSESRKFGVGLVLAHQYLDQLTPSVLSAVLGNVGSKIVFRLGAHDAETIAPEFEPTFSPSDLQGLPAHHTLVKLLARGRELSPFLSEMLPPVGAPDDGDDRAAAIRRASRGYFAQPRREVEAMINIGLAPRSTA